MKTRLGVSLYYAVAFRHKSRGDIHFSLVPSKLIALRLHRKPVNMVLVLQQIAYIP